MTLPSPGDDRVGMTLTPQVRGSRCTGDRRVRCLPGVPRSKYQSGAGPSRERSARLRDGPFERPRTVGASRGDRALPREELGAKGSAAHAVGAAIERADGAETRNDRSYCDPHEEPQIRHASTVGSDHPFRMTVSSRRVRCRLHVVRSGARFPASARVCANEGDDQGSDEHEEDDR